MRYISIAVLPLLLLWMLQTATGVAAGYDDRSVAKGSREEQIVFWEQEIDRLRSGEMAKAYQALYSSQLALKEAKQRGGWLFTSADDKARIKMLDAEYEKNMAALTALKREEEGMLAKVKPLYGIISRRFAQEQRHAILDAVKDVQQMSYVQAWYNSLLDLGEAGTLTDVIVGFFWQWLVGYVFFYHFAAIYYALWTAPWNIYAYSSGPSDVLVGIVAWCVCVTIMLLPVLALVAGFFYIRRYYGDRVAEALNRARQRERGRY
ncbi:hypothetical protein TraAM80_02280 [Trypanosoma rangeli]|uniref:Uncharacterized protein n=1 Tax=Trypanosoma rangeli TaxID=5698 RepID=A0A422NUT6_TRYRA|nr:uncharacterized protein TraAM80_02280 [Trypanosoma rangeli]RNF09237.1 hypothetical protein TraAM80_02280 [Trypanosoma rangeli]|eukprot:RNF09237.1 hypothetical protein TraAM80_02280 [Trypanosoma rangeli]